MAEEPEPLVTVGDATSNRTKVIGRRGVRVIEEMAALGHSDASIAKALKMHRNTLVRACKRQPEVQEALLRGRSQMEDVLVASLMKRALNEKSKGGTTAAIFLLKSLRGYEGTKLPEHLTINQNTHNVLNIQLPSAMDMETYMRRVAAGSPPVIEGSVDD